MAKRILVPLAEGFEEIEAMCVIDVLRRAEAEVVTAGITDGLITGRSGVAVKPDMTLDEALAGAPFDMIVLPGGMPASATLRDDPRVTSKLKNMKKAGMLIGAICAAPIAIDKAGLLEGEQFTSYPGMAKSLPKEGYSEQRVVKSGKMITSRGPGTALEFALEIVRELFGDEKAAALGDEVLA